MVTYNSVFPKLFPWERHGEKFRENTVIGHQSSMTVARPHPGTGTLRQPQSLAVVSFPFVFLSGANLACPKPKPSDTTEIL